MQAERIERSIPQGEPDLQSGAIPSRRRLHIWRRWSGSNAQVLSERPGSGRVGFANAQHLQLGGIGQERSDNTLRYAGFRDQWACQPCPTIPNWRNAGHSKTSLFRPHPFPTESSTSEVYVPNWRRAGSTITTPCGAIGLANRYDTLSFHSPWSSHPDSNREYDTHFECAALPFRHARYF